MGLARGELPFGSNEAGLPLWTFNGGEDGACGMGVSVLVEDSARTSIWSLPMEAAGVGIGALKIGPEDVTQRGPFRELCPQSDF